VDELSMAPSAIPVIKYIIRHSTFIEARSMAARALLCKTAGEVMEICKAELKKTIPDVIELIHPG
jgi:phosphoenolpyruvate-protein kinase (PTS system EI component)